MSEMNTEVNAEVKTAEGGRIIFANDVVATIAALAAADVPGVAAMSGGMMEGFTEKLGKKNLTKGVKVEVGAEEAAVDLSTLIHYGFKIQDVCANVQKAVKNAVETMTGLKVVEVNVFVQGIVFDTPDKNEKKKEVKEKEPEIVVEAVEPEPPRVK